MMRVDRQCAFQGQNQTFKECIEPVDRNEVRNVASKFYSIHTQIFFRMSETDNDARSLANVNAFERWRGRIGGIEVSNPGFIGPRTLPRRSDGRCVSKQA